MQVEIIVPSDFVGNILKLTQERRGVQRNLQYIDDKRMMLEYEMPLIEIIFDFYDKLKSVSRGYASLDYSFLDFRRSPIVKVDILINSEKVDAMSFMCHEDKAFAWGKSITQTLSGRDSQAPVQDRTAGVRSDRKLLHVAPSTRFART